MSDLNSIFSLSANDFKEDEPKMIERYKIDAKQGTDNVYTSLVRFIPWWKNPKESIKSKWTSWLEDPDTGEGRFVDCPSSIGKKSILQDIYWKLKKSDNVAEQELSKKFSRRQQFASLVQVIRDEHRPELNGKIFVYQYGVKIHKKLMGEMKPKYGAPKMPFDVFDGRPFLFQVTLVSGYNNYDECKFIDVEEPLKAGDELITEKTPENLEKIKAWLEKESPDLDKYGYQEWTSDTYDFVMRVVRNTVPKGRIVESIEKLNTQLSGKKPTTSTAPKSTVKETAKTSLNETIKDEEIPDPEPQSKVSDNDDLPDIDDIDLNKIDDELYANL